VAKILLLTYWFLTRCSITTTIRETSGVLFDDTGTSSETVSDTNSFCRGVMVNTLFTYSEPKLIGGDECVVEIDLSIFRNTKKGKMIEEVWILCGFCPTTNETFFSPVEDSSEETLLSHIQRNVTVGSTLQTDCLKTCSLEQLGYGHRTMSEAENVDPDSIWRVQKKSINTFELKIKNSLEGYIAEYIWHRKHANDDCKFTSFMRDVATLFPGTDE